MTRAGIIYGRPSLGQSARIQTGSIAALTMREMHTRFGDHYLGYLWLLGEPALLAMGVAAIHSVANIQLPWGMTVAPYTIGGYTGFLLFRYSCTRSGAAISSNRTLLYHRYITLFDILFSRAIVETLSAMGAGVVLLGAAWALGLGTFMDRPLLFLEAWGFNAWYCFGMAMLCCSWVTVWENADRFIHPLTYFALPISGAFSLLTSLPPPIRPYVALFPPCQISEMIREGIFGNFDSPYVSVPYMVGVSLFTTVLGTISLRAIRNRVEI